MINNPIGSLYDTDFKKYSSSFSILNLYLKLIGLSTILMGAVYLNRHDEEYMHRCATQQKFTYGIIVGQKAEPGKFMIAHLAKNGDEDIDEDVTIVGNGSRHISEIDLPTITNQWLSASKMIPGSFEILGIFVASVSDQFIEELSHEFTSAKILLYDIHNLLKQNSPFGNILERGSQYLYLSYSSSSHKAVCKLYNYVANGGTFASIDCRFVEKPFEWHCIESNYELDDVFPILDNMDNVSIEEQFHRVVETVHRNLNASEIFLQNENVEDSQLLDDYIQRQANKYNNLSIEDCFQATIFLPIKCLICKCENAIHVREFNGTLRLQGAITSRIWCNPKNTLADVKQFLRRDILRSLMARVEIYCDGLTDPTISNEMIFISEPPRRIYFNVNTGHHNVRPIQFSEYIFRGEATTVAIAQAKQILDLDITPDNIFVDWESLPSDETFSDAFSENPEKSKPRISNESENMVRSEDITRIMYILGVTVALIVLVISIIANYILK